MIEPVFKLVGDRFIITEGYGTITTSKTLTHSENIDDKVKMESEELEEVGQNRPGGQYRKNLAGQRAKTPAPKTSTGATQQAKPSQPAKQNLLPASNQNKATQTGLARVQKPGSIAPQGAPNNQGLATNQQNNQGLATNQQNNQGLARASNSSGLATTTKMPQSNQGGQSSGLAKTGNNRLSNLNIDPSNVEDAEYYDYSDDEKFNRAKDVTGTAVDNQPQSEFTAEKGTVADSILKAGIGQPQQVLDGIVNWGKANNIQFDPNKLGKLAQAAGV